MRNGAVRPRGIGALEERVLLAAVGTFQLTDALRVANRLRMLSSARYINRGGTLDTGGVLFANRCNWTHVLRAVVEPEVTIRNNGDGYYKYFAWLQVRRGDGRREHLLARRAE